MHTISSSARSVLVVVLQSTFLTRPHVAYSSSTRVRLCYWSSLPVRWVSCRRSSAAHGPLQGAILLRVGYSKSENRLRRDALYLCRIQLECSRKISGQTVIIIVSYSSSSSWIMDFVVLIPVLDVQIACASSLSWRLLGSSVEPIRRRSGASLCTQC